MKDSPLTQHLFTTKQERNGTLVLAFIVLLAIATNRLLPVLFTPQVQMTAEQLDKVAIVEENFKKTKSNKIPKPSVPIKDKEPKVQSTPVFIQEFEKVELNTADTTDLKALYGIGAKTASSILKYRKILGGYADPEQLFEVYRIDSLTVMSLLPRFTADLKLIQKLNINQLGLYDLKRHPYISMELARVIVESRYKIGEFENLEQLKERGLVNAEYYPKIAPYLSCE